MPTTDEPLMKPPSPATQRKVNKWAARIIPLLLVGAVGYATWVVIVLLCVNYLLHPPTNIPKRTTAGIVIIVIYCVLLLVMASAYFRTIQVVLNNPGLVPRQDPPEQKGVDSDEFLDRGSVSGGRSIPPAGLEAFYNRDVFECEVDGLPKWCSICKNWKPDRSHHCSEIGRCVFKMDHYCPWVGGIVSETAFKFFIQFCFYAMLYCTLVLVVIAYFFAKRHDELRRYDVNWAVVIGLSAFFGLFASGMAMTSSYFAFTNLSTVENLARRTRTYNLAVLLPPTNIPPPTTTSYRTITYPLAATPEEQLHAPRPGQRTFAILSVRQGQNPYSLSPFENFKQVLGNRLWDWFLPIRLSPCCAHGRGDAEGGSVSSMYPMGSVFEKVKADAGLPTSGPVGEKAGEVIE